MEVISIVSIAVTIISIVVTLMTVKKQKEKDAQHTKLKASISLKITIK